MLDLGRQMNSATDREIALVLQAWLEAGLEKELKRRMPNLGQDMQSELFGGLGPLASFRAKIVIGFGLGVYGPITLSDLNLIKEIRNAFAHSPFLLDFNDF